MSQVNIGHIRKEGVMAFRAMNLKDRRSKPMPPQGSSRQTCPQAYTGPTMTVPNGLVTAKARKRDA